MRPQEALQLAPLNDQLERTGQLPINLSAHWVWRCTPEEPLTQAAMLNECHLLGLLLCRQQPPGPPLPPPTPGGVVLLGTAPHSMTLTELRDSVDNALIELPTHRHAAHPATAFIDGCFHRFGALAAQGGGADTLNDSLIVEEHTDPAAPLKLSRPAIRRFLASFLIMYRHVHLAAIAEPVPPAPYDCGIRKHHMEASSDAFGLLAMRMRLPAAAVLNYKQDFTGFFNHISQVVYFHNPAYQPLQRIPLAEAARGDPLQVLPAIQLLYPDIRTYYEEDAFDITRPLGHWAWIVLPGRVYLAGPDARVYHSDNVTALVGVYKATPDA